MTIGLKLDPSPVMACVSSLLAAAGHGTIENCPPLKKLPTSQGNNGTSSALCHSHASSRT